MKIYKLGRLPEELYPLVGGKAKGLDMLVRKGFAVPHPHCNDLFIDRENA